MRDNRFGYKQNPESVEVDRRTIEFYSKVLQILKEHYSIDTMTTVIVQVLKEYLDVYPRRLSPLLKKQLPIEELGPLRDVALVIPEDILNSIMEKNPDWTKAAIIKRIVYSKVFPGDVHKYAKAKKVLKTKKSKKVGIRLSPIVIEILNKHYEADDLPQRIRNILDQYLALYPERLPSLLLREQIPQDIEASILESSTEISVSIDPDVLQQVAALNPGYTPSGAIQKVVVENVFPGDVSNLLNVERIPLTQPDVPLFEKPIARSKQIPGIKLPPLIVEILKKHYDTSYLNKIVNNILAQYLAIYPERLASFLTEQINVGPIEDYEEFVVYKINEDLLNRVIELYPYETFIEMIQRLIFETVLPGDVSGYLTPSISTRYRKFKKEKLEWIDIRLPSKVIQILKDFYDTDNFAEIVKKVISRYLDFYPRRIPSLLYSVEEKTGSGLMQYSTLSSPETKLIGEKFVPLQKEKFVTLERMDLELGVNELLKTTVPSSLINQVMKLNPNETKKAKVLRRILLESVLPGDVSKYLKRGVSVGREDDEVIRDVGAESLQQIKVTIDLEVANQAVIQLGWPNQSIEDLIRHLVLEAFDKPLQEDLLERPIYIKFPFKEEDAYRLTEWFTSYFYDFNELAKKIFLYKVKKALGSSIPWLILFPVQEERLEALGYLDNPSDILEVTFSIPESVKDAIYSSDLDLRGMTIDTFAKRVLLHEMLSPLIKPNMLQPDANFMVTFTQEEIEKILVDLSWLGNDVGEIARNVLQIRLAEIVKE